MPDQGPFSGDAHNVMRWLSVGGIVFALIAGGLIVFVLRKPGAWRAAAAGKLTLFLGLCLLPTTTMFAGNVVGFHNVKHSCGSCHTMDPWIADLQDPDSKTLASKHHRNRWINEDSCYTCHTGYGLAGNVHAKLSGLSHVWHEYVTGAPKEIRIHRPFDQRTCLHCHAGAASYVKIEQHTDPEFQPKILSGETSCFECHEAPHPRPKKP